MSLYGKQTATGKDFKTLDAAKRYAKAAVNKHRTITMAVVTGADHDYICEFNKPRPWMDVASPPATYDVVYSLRGDDVPSRHAKTLNDEKAALDFCRDLKNLPAGVIHYAVTCDDGRTIFDTRVDGCILNCDAVSFSQLDRAAAGIRLTDPVCAGVNYMIAQADDNMPDEAGKMDSLRGLLAYATSPDAATVRHWFSVRGVTW